MLVLGPYLYNLVLGLVWVSLGLCTLHFCISIQPFCWVCVVYFWLIYIGHWCCAWMETGVLYISCPESVFKKFCLNQCHSYSCMHSCTRTFIDYRLSSQVYCAVRQAAVLLTIDTIRCICWVVIAALLIWTCLALQDRDAGISRSESTKYSSFVMARKLLHSLAERWDRLKPYPLAKSMLKDQIKHCWWVDWNWV